MKTLKKIASGKRKVENMKKLMIIFLVVLLLASMVACKWGGDRNPKPTPTPRTWCALTGSGGVRCFELPDYPKLSTPEP